MSYNPAAGGQFELIKTFVVGVDTVGPVNSIVFSGLNGNTDAHYIMMSDFIGGPGGTVSVWLTTDFMVGSVTNSQNMAGGAPQLVWYFGRASIVTGNSYHVISEFNSKTAVSARAGPSSRTLSRAAGLILRIGYGAAKRQRST